jgi:SPP1 gp7 family putative phage head morphogenesis protein
MSKHEEYWTKRLNDILTHIDREDIDIFDELNRMYQKASKELQDEIFEFYGKYATDNNISKSEAKKRLRGTDLSDYQENARKYREEARDNPELLERLNEQYVSSKVTRLEALYLEVVYVTGVLNGEMQLLFSDYLKRVAQHSYSKVMGGLSDSTLSPHVLEQIISQPWDGYNYSEALWGNTDHLAQNLKDTLLNGFIKGHHPRQMAQGIRKEYGVARSRAETLVRTDGTHVVNNASMRRYKDAGLTKYKIHVHIDDRTTKICRNVHQADEEYLISEAKPGINLPPLHYNCRSTVIPLEEEINIDL